MSIRTAKKAPGIRSPGRAAIVARTLRTDRWWAYPLATLITKCCTEVCPAGIKITDNAIISMKERSADQRYDPLGRVLLSWRRRPGRT